MEDMPEDVTPRMTARERTIVIIVIVGALNLIAYLVSEVVRVKNERLMERAAASVQPSSDPYAAALSCTKEQQDAMERIYRVLPPDLKKDFPPWDGSTKNCPLRK